MTTMARRVLNRKTIAAAGFCLALLLLFVSGIAQKDSTFSETEKRVLSPFPKWSWSSLAEGKFTSELETYLQDQMPWRNAWVGLAAYFDHAAGQNGTDGVYACGDDYIMNTPTKENARSLSSNLRYLTAFADQMQKPTYLLVVPETGYILSDKLPRGHADYPDSAVLSDIAALTRGHIETVDVADLFFSHARDIQLYYRTDHHWTSGGAFLAANAFLEQAGRPALSADLFTAEDVPGFRGTTHAKLCMWGKPADIMQLWHIRDAQLQVEITDLGKPQTTTAQDVFFRDHLQAYDMYPVFLNGNHSLTHIVNPAAPDGVLLLIKDSFGNTLATELAAAFREIWMVDLRYFRTQALSEQMADKHVDTVLINYGLDSLVHDTNILWLK